MEYILPFSYAIDALLAIWVNLPQPIYAFINVVFLFFLITSIIRGVMK